MIFETNTEEFQKVFNTFLETEGARRVGAVYLDALTMLDAEIVRNTRVDTGYLRSSFTAARTPVSTAPSFGRNKYAKGRSTGHTPSFQAQMISADAERASAFLSAAQLLDGIYLGFTADYAPYREDIDHMVARGAAQWPQFFASAIAKLGMAP